MLNSEAAPTASEFFFCAPAGKLLAPTAEDIHCPHLLAPLRPLRTSNYLCQDSIHIPLAHH